MRAEHSDYQPDILGIEWNPGDLILVAGHIWDGKTCYVLGNCIIEGTQDKIPVAYFCPAGCKAEIEEQVMRMQVGNMRQRRTDISLKEVRKLPLYIDDTPNLSIDYLLNRIFHLVKYQHVQMVVINYLQAMDIDIFGSEKDPESGFASILCILKAIAASLNLVIIVTSKLSANSPESRPTLRDVLDIEHPEEYCDQVILLHSNRRISHHDERKIILPFGPFGKNFPLKENGPELVINAIWDYDTGCFKKANHCFSEEEEEDLPSDETPMYEWYPATRFDEWYFEFIDLNGMGWKITISPVVGSDDGYHIEMDNWAGDNIPITESIITDDMDKLRAFALRKAREHFPEIEIPEKC